MIVITADQTYGIYQTVEELSDRLLCDGKVELPYSVIGAYTISADDSLMPPPPAPPAPSYGTIISKLAYFQRYPQEKWFILKDAKDATAIYAKEVFDLATVVDLSDPRAIQLVDLLTNKTGISDTELANSGKSYLLSQEEANSILNTPVSVLEVPAFQLAK